jgi:hypothetical protein
MKQRFTKVQEPASYDFATYNNLLHDFVADGLVDYTSLQKSPLLNKAVEELVSVSPDKFPDKAAKMSYWINAYNLLIMKNICEHYPIKSIRALNNAPSFTKYIVAGDIYSVKDILETRLDPYFEKDPLATFVVNGGCQGCPPLINHAINAKDLQKDEQENLRKFINDPRNYKYDDVVNTFSIAPYFSKYSDEYSTFFDSPHALANAYMTQHINVGSATMITNYLPFFNYKLNDKALGKVDAEGNKINDKG